MTFRIGATDASNFARELSPTFAADDLIALPRYHAYVRLTIDGHASAPFSAVTIGVEYSFGF